MAGPSIYLAAVAAVIAVFGLAAALYYYLQPERSASDRLAEFTGGADRADRGTTQLPSFARTAARLASGDDTEKGALTKMLVQAGFRGRGAAEIYGFSRAVGALALAFLLAGACFFVLQKHTILWMVGSTLFGATIGYYAPYLYVTNTLQKRRELLMRGFPDALDLLVSTVEAGLGLDAAFRRVADEMEGATPELAAELQQVTHEVNAGIPRVEGLRRMEERCGVDDITSLVNVLIQAERFGTSVSRALRIHSEHIRVKRMQRAETKAAQVSPKLTVAMIFFILPCLIFILLGPALISVKNIVMPNAPAAAQQ